MLAGMGSFDVALLEALLSAGVSPERARTVVELFDRCVDERYSLHAQVLATKRDVAELETRLTKDIAELRARTQAGIADLRGEMQASIAQTQASIVQTQASIAGLGAEMRASIAETKADLAKWTLAALTAQTALLLGAIKLF